MLARAARVVALSAWGMSASHLARATECHPASGMSPCLDADALWSPTGAARWLSFPSSEPLGSGKVSLAISGQAVFKPLRFSVASPNPNGKDVFAVERRWQEELLLAIGVQRWELGLALPSILHQVGAGNEALTSQRAAPIDSAGERDPRLSVARWWALTAEIATKPRLQVTLPLGNRDGYASSAVPIFAPALPFELHSGRWALGIELGLRLRPSVELGTARYGSFFETHLGAAFEILPRKLLDVSTEAFALLPLENTSSLRARAAELETRLIPAEWLSSLRCRPFTDPGFSVAIGVGTGLALSSESSSIGQQHFVAPTSPGLRLLAELRYAPVE